MLEVGLSLSRGPRGPCAVAPSPSSLLAVRTKHLEGASIGTNHKGLAVAERGLHGPVCRYADALDGRGGARRADRRPNPALGMNLVVTAGRRARSDYTACSASPHLSSRRFRSTLCHAPSSAASAAHGGTVSIVASMRQAPLFRQRLDGTRAGACDSWVKGFKCGRPGCVKERERNTL